MKSGVRTPVSGLWPSGLKGSSWWGSTCEHKQKKPLCLAVDLQSLCGLGPPPPSHQSHGRANRCKCRRNTVMQNQKAASACRQTEQILPFCFARQHSCVIRARQATRSGTLKLLIQIAGMWLVEMDISANHIPADLGRCFFKYWVWCTEKTWDLAYWSKLYAWLTSVKLAQHHRVSFKAMSS